MSSRWLFLFYAAAAVPLIICARDCCVPVILLKPKYYCDAESTIQIFSLIDDIDSSVLCVAALFSCFVYVYASRIFQRHCYYHFFPVLIVVFSFSLSLFGGLFFSLYYLLFWVLFWLFFSGGIVIRVTCNETYRTKWPVQVVIKTTNSHTFNWIKCNLT